MPDSAPNPAKPAANRAAPLSAGVRANAQKAAGNARQEFLRFTGEVKKSVLDFASNWQKFRDIVKNNYELGRLHLGRGNLQDAMLRLRFVLWLQPAHVDAMYYLGATYMAMGNRRKAADYLAAAVKLRPAFEEARYLLCTVSPRKISKDQLPKTMPRALAIEYFDAMAPGYNTHQLQTLKYEGHLLLGNMLRSCLVPGRMDHVLLELGVGTGLCAPVIRDVASHITGVDFSAAMLEEAVKVVDHEGKKTYDALIKREALEFLKDCPDEGYDIILSAGMFSYIGDFAAYVEEARRVLKPKGLLAFTADVLPGHGFEFVPRESRFAFARDYIDALAGSGLAELKCKDLAVYADYPAWVCVFQKP